MDLTPILRRMLAERRARVWDVVAGAVVWDAVASPLRPRELEESVALEAAITAVEEQEQRRAAAPMRNLMNGY